MRIFPRLWTCTTNPIPSARRRASQDLRVCRVYSDFTTVSTTDARELTWRYVALHARNGLYFGQKCPKTGCFGLKFSNPDDEAFGQVKPCIFKGFRGFRRRRRSNLPQFYHSNLRYSQIKDTASDGGVFFTAPYFE